MDFLANQKARKAIDNVRVILNKIHLSCLRQAHSVFSPDLFLAFDHFYKKQIDAARRSTATLTMF